MGNPGRARPVERRPPRPRAGCLVATVTASPEELAIAARHPAAAEASTWSADYGGAEQGSRRREHAVGTSQVEPPSIQLVGDHTHASAGGDPGVERL